MEKGEELLRFRRGGADGGVDGGGPDVEGPCLVRAVEKLSQDGGAAVLAGSNGRAQDLGGDALSG
jgi:hypothetical protein